MNESYYKLCINELNTIKDKKRILLHSCCAPCSSHVISFLSNYFDITILYYNPNISPIDEYLKRKEEQIKLIKELKTKNKVDFLDCDYECEKYQKAPVTWCRDYSEQCRQITLMEILGSHNRQE